MQEAKFLLENFKVEKVIINAGHINYLEKELIKNYSNIYMSKQNQVITCGDITLQQLNKDLTDENDSSQVYYGTYKNLKMVFTGDASDKTEQFILSNYNLGHIDILKVGHHGSKTSSSKKFINTIKPKYSLISCGKDNKFGHPNKEGLAKLKDSIIYRTDIDGSIAFNVKKDTLEIKTCPP